MHTEITRRNFLHRSLTLSLAISGAGLLTGRRGGAIEPIKRKGSSRLSLSIAAYSFRDYFNHKDPAKRISLFDFIDFCADQGCQGAELTSYYFPPNVDEKFLIDVKRHAFLRGVAISGSAVGNNFALPPGPERDQQIKMVKRWIDYAAILGAPHIRVFAGDKGKMSVEEARKLGISGLEECCDYAGSKGIFLGIENHGGIVAEADELLAIVRAVKSPWFGVNLDTGNFQTDDPYADLAKCAPYAVNVQVKVEIKARGKPKEQSDYAKMVKLLRDANYQGYLALEYESAEDPYQAIPVALRALREAVRS